MKINNEKLSCKASEWLESEDADSLFNYYGIKNIEELVQKQNAIIKCIVGNFEQEMQNWADAITVDSFDSEEELNKECRKVAKIAWADANKGHTLYGLPFDKFPIMESETDWWFSDYTGSYRSGALYNHRRHFVDDVINKIETLRNDKSDSWTQVSHHSFSLVDFDLKKHLNYCLGIWGEKLDKYESLVSMARKSESDSKHPNVARHMEETEALYPDDVARLCCPEEGDWAHGFNSGCLAAYRHVLHSLDAIGGIQCAEDEFPDLDT